MPSIPMPPGGKVADALVRRPAIGQRVRCRSGFGVVGVDWCGFVVAHHADGIAVRVQMDDGRILTGDSKNFDLIERNP